MRYRVNRAWPVRGGSVVIPGGVIIDDTQKPPDYWTAFVIGVIPPPDAQPLDQATHDSLANAYNPTKYWPPIVIAPVPGSLVADAEQTNKSAKLKV